MKTYDSGAGVTGYRYDNNCTPCKGRVEFEKYGLTHTGDERWYGFSVYIDPASADSLTSNPGGPGIFQPWGMPRVRLAWSGSPFAARRPARRGRAPADVRRRAGAAALAVEPGQVVRRAGSASRRVAARSGFRWDPGLPRPDARLTVTRATGWMFPEPPACGYPGGDGDDRCRRMRCSAQIRSSASHSRAHASRSSEVPSMEAARRV